MGVDIVADGDEHLVHDPGGRRPHAVLDLHGLEHDEGVARSDLAAGLDAALGELRLYAGYDAGFIHRDADDEYEQGALQGAALGLRTRGGYLDSDLCLSKPVDAPAFMKNRDWEIYWELNSNF